ncbi:unnamed protein product [Polarella glacialis]|uniref:RanBP2-type domain-containing protein n=1 Tax=Polarella glacialis TaxID=89957 RepID=A0A813GPF9_POLGL|nr:unnamed protein product [Polarella glacialis]
MLAPQETKGVGTEMICGPGPPKPMEGTSVGLTLRIRLPSGRRESVSVNSADFGHRVWSLLKPLADMRGLRLSPPQLLEDSAAPGSAVSQDNLAHRLLRADGRALLLDATLEEQGLRDGSTLQLLEPPRRRSASAAPVVVTEADVEATHREAEASRTWDTACLPREEREATASNMKDRANVVLKDGQFAAARDLYSAAILCLPPEDSDEQLAAALFGNRALAHLKLEEWGHARDDAEQSLQLVPSNVKVRYRLGVAFRELGELEAAARSFRAVLDQDASDCSTQQALAAVESEICSSHRQKSGTAPQVFSEPAPPESISWRFEQLQRGFELPRLQAIWRELPEGVASDNQNAMKPAHIAALRHALRCQTPIARFFQESLAVASAAAQVSTSETSEAASTAPVRQPAVFSSATTAGSEASAGASGEQALAAHKGRTKLLPNMVVIDKAHNAAVVLGAGCMAAAHACAQLLGTGALLQATVVEPCGLLSGLAERTSLEVLGATRSSHSSNSLSNQGNTGSNEGSKSPGQEEEVKMLFLRSQGQIDNEFAVPAVAFQVPSKLRSTASLPTRSLVLPWEEFDECNSVKGNVERAGVAEKMTWIIACDRLCDDLLGEGLVTSLAAGCEAARRHLPKASGVVRCVPSSSELICTPLELRSGEAFGWDISRANALRFSAHASPEESMPQRSRSWKCQSCSWSNSPQLRLCEVCRVERQKQSDVRKTGLQMRESLGWWPVDLDHEASRASSLGGTICRLCAEEQVLFSFDFDEPSTFAQQRRVEERVLEARATCDCRVNAIAVWWRLQGPGGTELTTRPGIASMTSAGGETSVEMWPGKRQAVYYLGYEVGIEEGEVMRFGARLHDNMSRVKFELLQPRLSERMGLMKFEMQITSSAVLQQLQEKLDLKSNRLMASIPGTPLKRRDKLLEFGPFDVVPGSLRPELWRKVEEKPRLHTERPKRGDEPVRCLFRRGAYEGTVRWPRPSLAAGASVPRLPRYFEALTESRLEPFLLAMTKVLDSVQQSPLRARVLELCCGPVPLLALCAARAGARAWALESEPSLREMALETVRDQGLEMVFQYKGFSSYSFFGSASRPGGAGVRVLRASPSTSLKAGAGDPKFLDGARAHVVVCRPDDDGPLNEAFLENTWHAAEELLEDGGRLVPSGLLVKVVAVEWLPLLDGCMASACLLHPLVCEGFRVQAEMNDLLRPLSSCSEVALRINLSARPPAGNLPAAEGFIEVQRAGVFTAFAFWHEPDFEEGDEWQEDELDSLPSLATILHLGALGISPVISSHASAKVCFLPLQEVKPGDRLGFALRFEGHELTALRLVTA